MATATSSELTYFSFPIVKFSKNDEGDLVVYGKATDASLDSDDQVVDHEWSGKALQDWHNSGGNVRVQHQAMRDPAGKSMTVEIDRDGDTGHWVKSLVVEPVAKRLVEKGVLTAYSVGIARPVIRRDPTGKARGGIVAGGSLAEISLVDRPANKSCGLVMAKAQGGSMELVEDGLFGDDDYLSKVRDDPDFLAKADSASSDGDGDAKPAKPAATPSGGGSASDQSSSDDGQDGQDGDGGDDAQDEDDTDGGEDAISKASDPTRVEYRRARREWLAREPAVKSAVGGTEYLQRRTQWLRWNAEGDAEGLNGTREGAMLWLAKRGAEPAAAMDPDAGYLDAEASLYKRDVNTAERRQLAQDGNALPDGSYPIKNTGDLANAAHLAQTGHGDVEAARRLIARRAKELGVANPLAGEGKKSADPDGALAKGSKDCAGCGRSYDADTTMRNCEGCGKKLPSADAGKADGGGECGTCHGSGKIMDGNRDCPDCNAATGDATGDAAKAVEVPEEVKRSKCGGCGTSFDADHPGKFCSGCGNKLPGMDKADGGVSDADLLALAETVAKSVEAGLITQAAGDEIIAVAAEKRAASPLPADTAPAKPHREPDGTSTVERLEHQAGMPTDPDKDPDKVPVSVQGVGEGMNARKADYSVTRMHDALCAAYDGAEVLDAYPSLKSVADSVDEGWYKAQVAQTVEAGDAAALAAIAPAWQAAAAIKGMDRDAVADGRAELHKAFTDMYPTEHIKPGAPIRPGSYQRPYLSAGHAAENASHNGGANVPPSSRTPEPEQFRRPLITGGHESDSPANKDAGDIRSDAPVRTGASRVYYSNAQREAARVAMQAIHDHISGNFPDMCPMAASKSVMPPDMGSRNVPVAAAPEAASGVPSVKIDGPLDGAALAKNIAEAIRRHAARTTTATAAAELDRDALEKAAAAAGLTLVKAENPGCGCCPDCTAAATKGAGTVDLAPIVSAPAGLTVDQIKALLTETFNPYQDRLSELQKQLDDVAARPDPALAPIRGQLAKAATGAGAAPVERRSLVDEAASAARAAREQAQASEAADYRTYITTLTKSPDPSTRERALTVLNKLNGV